MRNYSFVVYLTMLAGNPTNLEAVLSVKEINPAIKTKLSTEMTEFAKWLEAKEAKARAEERTIVEKEKTEEMVRALLKFGKLGTAEIASVANVSESYVQQIKANVKGK